MAPSGPSPGNRTSNAWATGWFPASAVRQLRMSPGGGRNGCSRAMRPDEPPLSVTVTIPATVTSDEIP